MMIKKYESVIILKSDLTEEQINESINKFKELMKDVEIEYIGNKKLAYEIKGQKEGYYISFNFDAEPETITEIERRYRIDEQIMKFIVVRVED